MSLGKRLLGPDDPPVEGAREVRLEFDQGTLVLDGVEEGELRLAAHWAFDDRIGRYRTHAMRYRAALAELLRAGLAVRDLARGYEVLGLPLRTPFEPFPHQAEAIAAWEGAGKRGTVILPTGAGKTFVAQLAIASVDRDCLIVVPTIDLLQQWAGVLERAFETTVGMIGGGSFEIEPITVSTYDSACRHMDHLGARFGLLVFDEVHHLPGEMYVRAAESAIAPFRLGLTATYERSDGKERQIEEVLGPPVFARSIKELSGDVLADYEVRPLLVRMDEEDAALYDERRREYRQFVDINHIRLGGQNGWQRFLAATSRSREGRSALRAYFSQKRLALVHAAKLRVLYELLGQHHDDRVIIFTNDNESVYHISERVLCPAITHQTPVKERREILESFNAGRTRTIATSKVLNEGVDVPSASVAVILSGSGSVREHVQRLGRILRRAPDKRAILYELITDETHETFVSQRRREHDAYQ